MTVVRSVADVLDDHVVFEVESNGRMYLNVWQPRKQAASGGHVPLADYAAAARSRAGCRRREGETIRRHDQCLMP